MNLVQAVHGHHNQDLSNTSMSGLNQDLIIFIEQVS